MTGWGHADNKVELQSIDAASDKVPLIIPPTTEKVAYFQHETIRQIWARAGEALLGAGRLFAIGYSLPETDLSIRFFLQLHRAFGKIPLVIVNTDKKAPDHYLNLLGDFYDIDDTYVGDNAIERLVADLCDEV